MINKRVLATAMATVVGGAMLLVGGAVPASASDRWDYHRHHHSDAGRIAAYALGGLGLYGFATHNPTLGVVGVGLGALAYESSRHGDWDRHHHDWDRHDWDHRGWRR